MKKLVLMFVGVGIFLIVVGYFTGPNKNRLPIKRGESLVVNGKEISVEIADSEEERKQGLSGRTSLGKESGLLFVFDPPKKPSFWMKDMNFPIDIIWISDLTVIGIEKNVAPEPGVDDQNLRLYFPPDNVNYVLEINAGEADQYNIKIGDSITLPPSLTK